MMASFFSELKRRKVFKLAVVYLVVAWVLVQIVATVEAPLNLPAWVDTLAIVLLGIGFPIALIMSWAYDVTPKGIVRDGALDAEEEPDAPAAEDTRDTEIQTATDVLPNSVAVLPFENLSPDPDNAYFAAGVHEEILNRLAKISDLSVIARTSVLKEAYTNGEMSIPEIAQELNVQSVMEGSVRYAGDQVRITTQLIDPVTGAHLWSEAYDRELKDIFAIQSDIASNITDAIKAEFSIEEKKYAERPPTESLDAYHCYLRAMAVAREGDGAHSVSAPAGQRTKVQSLLDQAIALDSEFALAYAQKAMLYSFSKFYTNIAADNWIEGNAELDRQVRQNAERALSLDPNLGLAHGALAMMYQENWCEAEAREAFERSVALNQNAPATLFYFGALNWWTGHPEEAIRLVRQAAKLDPNDPFTIAIMGLTFQGVGKTEEAADIYRKGIEVNPSSPILYICLSMALVPLGNESEALVALRMVDQLMPDDASPQVIANIGWGYSVVGQREAAENIYRKVKSMAANRYIDPIAWTWAYLAKGDHDKAYESLAMAAENRALVSDIFPSQFTRQNFYHDPVLEEPRFVELRKKLKYTQE